MDMTGKGAVITGAAGGIGLGIAHALHKRGAKVMLADIEAEKAAQAARDLGENAFAAKLDVRQMADFEAVADAAWDNMGAVHIMVNNAGVGGGGPLLEADEADTAWVLDVNLKGVWRGCKVFGTRFCQQEEPAIICNIASEHGLGFPHKGSGIYTASKHAVLGLSDVLRHEVPAFIKICVACPGLVGTDIGASARNGPKGAPPPEIAARIKKFMDLGLSLYEAGEKIVKGMEREDFIIPTHPHAVKFAEARWQDISTAFAAHEPYTPESENMNVSVLRRKMGV